MFPAHALASSYIYQTSLLSFSSAELRNMAFPETKLQMPVRSISLPSRIHHPSAKFQAALSQIHLFQNSSDSQSLHASLLNLSELYHSLHQLNHSLPTAQAEHSLDVSATLLDSCDAARNLVLTLREHLLNLQSALRRKDKSMEVQIKEYFSFRKKIKKETNKLLLGLKKKLDDSETTELSVSIFRSLFMFLSTTSTMKTKTCSLKFVSRLISGGHRSSSSIMSELQNLDAVLRSDGDNSKEIKKMLERLEERTEELETALDSLFKSLVQYRVYLLNILTTHS
ncbi:hypothetical protein AtNW77_Chr3g0206661 [Arabidopsis thaliana]|jgi:DNA-binding transcriptional MerR regulator|uniref:At3g51410 n=7 Tax=Arabidopsis TaxID=3701 RepID=Q6NMZ5_ARATH|nr:hypothetical protein (DUF241) [Arabidopsis thaliana]KAG7628118.1 hypothetical protein ISN45_At03g044050 [Arabidopsis thaliana x Arabidopsis arenosa]KAG7634028.1 hypothetical protein ISN44_As03g042950 [Arabidopsis suecica]AAR20759.1 At3g51410 [Arabidopsis thaliana]AAS00346.1 At3g51410 [Arabidopsis thaliana]AEE78789.1 hypothetical protein (DUF241) [Arabidopsis thaliana]|eukprot:NP_190709.2 hypothetical protein (DUF241) [Arabidopsis thaliana]